MCKYLLNNFFLNAILTFNTIKYLMFLFSNIVNKKKSYTYILSDTKFIRDILRHSHVRRYLSIKYLRVVLS